jgi:DNA-binding transcriptional ArsR family regulator
MQDQDVSGVAAMMAALSQSTRLRIIHVVTAGDPAGTPAGEIARAVHCPASTLSFHLKELSQAGLLAAEPQGRFIRYRVVPSALQSLSDFVRGLAGTTGATKPEPTARSRRRAAGKKGEGQLSIFDE